MNNLGLPLDGTIKHDIVCLHKIDQQYDMPFHKHTVFELELYISGNINLITDKSTYHMQKGYLTLVPPGVWHRTMTVDVSSPYERIVLNIKKDLIDNLSTEQTDLSKCFYSNGINNINILKLSDFNMEKYINLCHKLMPIIDSKAYGDDVRRRNLLVEIMLISNNAPNSKHSELPNIIPPLIKRILEFIDENLSKNLTLTSFGNEFYLNPTYISRYFKSHIGLSLHSYIIEKRIECAKQLLIEGKNVSDVCVTCGFGNYSNFIRTFKKHVGISPGHYVH